MDILMKTLKQLRIGPPRTFAGLTVYPLQGPKRPQLGYLTLDQALCDGKARVTEVSEGGSVPELRFVNDGEQPVLLLDGEELVGAKQNRVLNLTILAPGKGSIVVPVTCVEAGRWSATSEEFAAADHVIYGKGRMSKSAQVSAALAGSGSRAANQGQVWEGVARLAQRYSVESPTSKLSDVFESRGKQLDDYVAAFQAVDGQVGAVFAVAGRLEGIDLFGDADMLRKLLPKLTRSWALEALQFAERPHEVPAPEAVRNLLDEVARAKTTSHEAVGLGTDVRLAGERLSGGALVHDGRVVHLCAFRRDEQGGQPADGQSRIARASRRHR